MTEMARHGAKRAVVEMELVKEEYIERSKNEVFSELKARLALPRHCMPNVRWGGGSRPGRRTQHPAQHYPRSPGRSRARPFPRSAPESTMVGKRAGQRTSTFGKREEKQQ